MNNVITGAATKRVQAALAALETIDRPEIWITLRGEADLLAEAAAIDTAVAAGAGKPLAGLLLAIKNNVDVAGIPTTAACPGFAYLPEKDAEAVARLRTAGALVLGATNLDQFATGLVGTRSPHGAVRDARRLDFISGGSSSGSAVAVALGLVDIAIGTDTAGSGRVPAGLQGIVGIKPTLDVVSTAGVVPACRSWDAVTIFARHLSTAELAMGVMAGGAREWPTDIRLAAPEKPRVAYPATLPALPEAWAAEFHRNVDRLKALGVDLQAIEFDAFLDAARLLYDGALVAERYAAVGDFLEKYDGGADHEAGIDPTVARIIRAAGTVPAHRYVADTARLEALKEQAMAELEGFDALLIPTAPFHPTLAEVAADPVGVNSLMGTYTNFCNLFDLCAVAVPAGEVDGAQFGLTVVARTFEDAVAADIARLLEATPDAPALFAEGAARPAALAAAAPSSSAPWPLAAGATAVPLVVVGAHRKGQPLAPQLEELGAAWDGPVRTAARYRMVSLDTVPPKPGVYRSDDDGAELAGERWLVSEAGLGRFLAALPEPMLLGSIELADGSSAVGFACDAVAAAEGEDITRYGDWLAAMDYLAQPKSLWQNLGNAALAGFNRGN
ncbi:allophanate hydrolase [Pseudarthrobacter siccitolerans]|uniref:Allophanate hydrolase n=1 Tax=Pseudarthrobacter siccitolerans TaxID=861266 RepID=A0ABU0PPC4_9MICC|nr:allophanate hydrolase [Pseudarthrobacter siccitolerans]MDQ0675392.1 allophanate hydrolase [Pseudarthrobacter siccitolerans]